MNKKTQVQNKKKRNQLGVSSNNRHVQLMFELLQVAVGNRKKLSCCPTEQEWKSLYEDAKRQALVGIMFVGIEMLPEGQWPPKILMLTWAGQTNRIVKRNMQMNLECETVTKLLKQEGFRCVVLKGQSNLPYYDQLSVKPRNYSLGMYRSPGDIDLRCWLTEPYAGTHTTCRSVTGIEKVVEFARQYRQMHQQPGIPWHRIIYLHVEIESESGTEVELHYRPTYLNNPFGNSWLQKWLEEQDYDRSVMCEEPFPSATTTFNAIFQLLHIYRHLFSEGVGYRQLLDYYCVLKAIDNDADKEHRDLCRTEILQAVRSFGVEKFLSAVMWVLQYTLEPNNEQATWMLGCANEKEGRYLLNEILKSGNFGKYDERLIGDKGVGTADHAMRRTSRNMPMALHYCGEVLWEPFFRVYHLIWRRAGVWRWASPQAMLTPEEKLGLTTIEWQFCQLLQIAIGTRKDLCDVLTDAQWQELYEMARKQMLIGITFAGIERMPERHRPSKLPMLHWMGQAQRIADKNIMITERCHDICQKFEADGYKVCVLKGQGNRMMYPKGLREYRNPGDIDVWAKPMDNSKNYVSRMVRYVIDQLPAHLHAQTLASKRPHHIEFPIYPEVEVELHFHPMYFSNPFLNRRFWRWCDEYIMRQDAFMKTDAPQFTIPRPEFNALYQLVHIYRHLFTEGIGLRQLIDYYYTLLAFNQSATQEQKAAIQKEIKKLGMYKFAGAVMWVLTYVLDRGTHGQEWLLCQPNVKEGKFLLREMIQAGNMGVHDERYNGMYSTNKLTHVLWTIGRNLTFVSKYPVEVICDPFMRSWNRIYNTWNKRFTEKKMD